MQNATYGTWYCPENWSPMAQETNRRSEVYLDGRFSGYVITTSRADRDEMTRKYESALEIFIKDIFGTKKAPLQFYSLLHDCKNITYQMNRTVVRNERVGMPFHEWLTYLKGGDSNPEIISEWSGIPIDRLGEAYTEMVKFFRRNLAAA